MSGKCPYSGAELSAPKKCPFHEDTKELTSGDEMCSHARKKLEARALEAASGISEERDWSKANGEELKAHFTSAYNNVASGVSNRGNAEIAKILVQELGYTEEEISVIGEDARLMQGTGNPHRLAALREGEVVVDLGSGFGIDAILASHRVGKSGRVVGIDLSIEEVSSAIKRVAGRKLRNVDFRLGDIESPPLEDASIDAVLSNGGFCLVPDKCKSFIEIFRMLKPGGRFSISCTVRKQQLDPAKQWPSCMVVFMPLEGLEDMLRGIGFESIEVDLSNSRVDLWDDENEKAARAKEMQESGKVTIHRGDPKFAFLKEMDMNEYFARVNVFGRKPN